jgi:predicted flap endonuclease-1-like 5' DNA nuclease
MFSYGVGLGDAAGRRRPGGAGVETVEDLHDGSSEEIADRTSLEQDVVEALIVNTHPDRTDSVDTLEYAGSSYAKKLEEQGVRTLRDLANVDVDLAEEMRGIGEKRLRSLKQQARGRLLPHETGLTPETVKREKLSPPGEALERFFDPDWYSHPYRVGQEASKLPDGGVTSTLELSELSDQEIEDPYSVYSYMDASNVKKARGAATSTVSALRQDVLEAERDGHSVWRLNDLTEAQCRELALNLGVGAVEQLTDLDVDTITAETSIEPETARKVLEVAEYVDAGLLE